MTTMIRSRAAAPDDVRPTRDVALRIATLTIVSFILTSTVRRAFPGLPAKLELLFEVLGFLGGFLLLLRLRNPTDAERATRAREQAILLVFAAVPASAALFAFIRGTLGDSLNHVASLLLLVVLARLEPHKRIVAAWRAVATLVVVSVALGFVYPPVVDHTARSAYLLLPGRLGGVFGTPNAMGQFAAILIILTVLRCGEDLHRWRWVVFGYFTLALCASQTALIVATVALLAAWIIRQAKAGRGAALVTGTCGVLAGLGVFVAVAEDLHPGSVLGIPGRLTLSNRTNVWSVLLARPIPTFGIGQTQLASILANSNIRGATGVASAHDAWVDAYVRDGIVGLVILIAAMVLMLGVIVVNRAPWALVGYVGFLVQCIPEVTPTHVPYYELFFVAMSVPLVLAKPRERVMRRSRG